MREYDNERRREGKTTGPWAASVSNGRCTKAAIVDMIREAIVSSGVTMQKAIG